MHDPNELAQRLRRLSNLPGLGVIASGVSTAQEREIQRALVDAAEVIEAIDAARQLASRDLDGRLSL